MGILSIVLGIFTFIGEWTTSSPILPPGGTYLGLTKEGMHVCGFAPVGPSTALVASHCVPKTYGRSIFVDVSNRAVGAEPIWGDYQLDIAVVYGAHGMTPMEIARPRWGSKVCLRNYQLIVKCAWVGMGEGAEVTRQNFTANFSPPIEPGDSGSAVIDRRGRLVGVVSAIYTGTPKAIIARPDALRAPNYDPSSP